MTLLVSRKASVYKIKYFELRQKLRDIEYDELDVPVRNLWLTTSLDSAEYVKNNKGADYNAEIEKLLAAVENTVYELKDITNRLFKGYNVVKAYELISDYRAMILDDIKQVTR
jgi:protein associated with RNAse G/E